MKKLLFISLLFLCFSGFSQQYIQSINVELPRGSRVEYSEVIDGVATHNYSTKNSIPINGSPFLHEYFQNGILELHDGKKSDEVLMRFNIAKDIFEILRKEDTLTLNRPFAVKYVYLDDKTFIFDPKFRKNAERHHNGYFQLSVEGKLSLYIKRRKDLKYDSFTENYKGGSGTKEYYYIDKVSFVGKTMEGKTFLLTSPKRLLSNLDDHKAEVKAFIKEHKIKFKKETDLVKVVEYYNSL